MKALVAVILVAATASSGEEVVKPVIGLGQLFLVRAATLPYTLVDSVVHIEANPAIDVNQLEWHVESESAEGEPFFEITSPGGQLKTLRDLHDAPDLITLLVSASVGDVKSEPEGVNIEVTCRPPAESAPEVFPNQVFHTVSTQRRGVAIGQIEHLNSANFWRIVPISEMDNDFCDDCSASDGKCLLPVQALCQTQSVDADVFSALFDIDVSGKVFVKGNLNSLFNSGGAPTEGEITGCLIVLAYNDSGVSGPVAVSVKVSDGHTLPPCNAAPGGIVGGVNSRGDLMVLGTLATVIGILHVWHRRVLSYRLRENPV